MGMDDFERKLRKLALVLNDMEKRGIKKSYMTVDLVDAEKITIQQKDIAGRSQQNINGKQFKI
jgi:hypothetical protein